MEYKDIFEGTCRLTEAKDPNYLGKLIFSWGQSDVYNKNHRYYPHKTFTTAVNELNTRAQKGAGIVGQLDHPVGGGSTLLANVAYLLVKTWMDENKIAWAEAVILDTTNGQNLVVILKSKAKIGASLRAYGEVDATGKVKPGLKVKTVDLVVDPSFGASATIDASNVFEGTILEEEEAIEEEDNFQSEEALEEVADEIAGLTDGAIEAIQEKLQGDNIEMTPERIKALALWIKKSKDDPSIAPFNEWFADMQEKLGVDDPTSIWESNEVSRRRANIQEEKRVAGFYGSDKRRIEARQKEIDEALDGSKYDQKTISRLFAEYVLTGGKLSRAEYIKEFGF